MINNNGLLQQGFTLIELVLVIIILSILGTMTSSYIANGIDLYTDIAARDKSLNSIRFVMERLNREVGNALPNSAVVTAGGQCLTFTPIIASSIYANDFPIAPVKSATGSVATMAGFAVKAGDKAVVYLLDSTELTDISKVKPIISIASSGTNDILTFNNSDSFALASPAKRLYIIRDHLSYYFNGDALYRGSECKATGTPNGVLMAEKISGSFAEEAPTLRRNGLVQAIFKLDFDGQEVPIEQTLHINNAP